MEQPRAQVPATVTVVLGEGQTLDEHDGIPVCWLTWRPSVPATTACPTWTNAGFVF